MPQILGCTSMKHVHVTAAKCSPGVHRTARVLGDGLSAGGYVGPAPPIASWRESKHSARVCNIEQGSMWVSAVNVRLPDFGKLTVAILDQLEGRYQGECISCADKECLAKNRRQLDRQSERERDIGWLHVPPQIGVIRIGTPQRHLLPHFWKNDESWSQDNDFEAASSEAMGGFLGELFAEPIGFRWTKWMHFIDGKVARHHRRRLVKQPGCEIARANEYSPHTAQQRRLEHRPSPDRVRHENLLRRSMPWARDASQMDDCILCASCLPESGKIADIALDRANISGRSYSIEHSD